MWQVVITGVVGGASQSEVALISSDAPNQEEEEMQSAMESDDIVEATASGSLVCGANRVCAGAPCTAVAWQFLKPPTGAPLLGIRPQLYAVQRALMPEKRVRRA